MAVIGFDHLVLRVSDVERTLEFYTGALGLAPVRVDEWRSGSAPFPSVRVTGDTIIDLVGGDGAPLDHLCLVVDAADAESLLANPRLTFADRTPAPRYGARGIAMSLYTADPDGNTVELRWYSD